jgi:glycoprotein-N-acetylgalactosamine 3-beta-galactosyltransferase
MWLKVRAIWQYVHDNYSDDYDAFHIGGDDMYVISENLRHVVSTGSWKGAWNQSAPLYLGGSMLDYPRTGTRYCGGGSGYTLNRVALKLLVGKLFDMHQSRPHFQASDEDRIIANCFRAVGLVCMDTNDHLNETRYHASHAQFHASWHHDDPAPWRYEKLETFHGIASKEGAGQISETSVSFHLKGARHGIEDRGIRRYHAILYGLCDKETQAVT